MKTPDPTVAAPEGLLPINPPHVVYDHRLHVLHNFELHAQRSHKAQPDGIVAGFAEPRRVSREMLVDFWRRRGKNSRLRRLAEDLLQSLFGMDRAQNTP